MPDRKKLLDKIGRAARVVFDYLEKHPRILYTTAGVVTVLSLKEELFVSTEMESIAPDGTKSKTSKTGFFVATSKMAYEWFRQFVQIGVIVLGLYLALLLVKSVWHSHRMHRIEEDAALARHAREEARERKQQDG